MGDDWRKYYQSSSGGFAHPESPDAQPGSGTFRYPQTSAPWTGQVPHPGSPAAQWFDWTRLPGYDTYQRARAVLSALEIAEREAPAAMLEASGEELHTILEGIIPGLLLCLAVLGVTSFVGAAAGAVVGSLAGGVGAIPGAGAGALVGLKAGAFILSWAGLGFLVGYIGFSVLNAVKLAIDASKMAWSSVELTPGYRHLQVQNAGKTYARALGELMRGILQAVVAFLLAKGAQAAAPRVAELCAKLRASKLGTQFAAWVETRWQALIENPKLKPAPAKPPPGEVTPGAGEGGGAPGGSKPAPKPAPKPQPKPAPEAEPKPEPKPAPEAEPKPEPKPEPKTESIGRKISQKQNRHVKGRPEWRDRGQGSYVESTADAQKVLDAYHSGDATVLGTTSQGHTVVRYDGVTGYNNNPGAGFVDQPTNVFLIKGTSSPSVVPTNPNWTPN